MTTRLVCRSAPLPTKHIAEQMEEDLLEEISRIEAEGCGMSTDHRSKRRVVASPEDTDNGQCWSEEIFSMLEGER